VKIALVSLLFAYTEALNLTLTSYDIPAQLLQILPYLSVVIVLMTADIKIFDGRAAKYTTEEAAE
jgi:simple sugar transport system permease protein